MNIYFEKLQEADAMLKVEYEFQSKFWASVQNDLTFILKLNKMIDFS